MSSSNPTLSTQQTNASPDSVIDATVSQDRDVTNSQPENCTTKRSSTLKKAFNNAIQNRGANPLPHSSTTTGHNLDPNLSSQHTIANNNNKKAKKDNC